MKLGTEYCIHGAMLLPLEDMLGARAVSRREMFGLFESHLMQEDELDTNPAASNNTTQHDEVMQSIVGVSNILLIACITVACVWAFRH